MQAIHFDQEVQVCEILNYWIFEHLCHASLFYFDFESMGYIFLFSSLFSLMLFGMDFYFFSICIAHIFFWQKKNLERERFYDVVMELSLFSGWMACFCVTLSVRVSTFISGCTWILIMGAWRESQQGSQQFDKAQHDNKQHMSIRFCNV